MAGEKVKLTKTFVDSVPLSPGKQVFYRDSDLTGFALRVTSVKTYIAEKKMPDGVPCRVTIGQHGLYTTTQAREKAREYILLMAQGINPNHEKKKFADSAKADRQASRSAPTLDEAYQAYKKERTLKPRTLTAYNMCVDDYFKDWKDTRLPDINKKMVQDRHAELTERSPAQANLSMKFLRALFNFSFEHYLNNDDEPIITVENPVKTLAKKKAWNKIKRRKTYIRSDQNSDWAHAVATTKWVGHQNDNMHAYTNQDYMFLLALTGFRRDEAEKAEWDKVDLKYGTITVVDTKNGEDLTLPMGEVLWHIMRERKKRAGNSVYVFPDRTGRSHINNRRYAREQVAEQSGISFTYHDLRRTFGSVANSLAIGKYTIKRLINHTNEDDAFDVTDGYVQVSFADMRKAMNMIEDVLIPEDVRPLIYNREYKPFQKR